MAETTQSVVTVANVTKTFKDFWLREKVTAVANLNLEVEPRQVFGLLGPNGSGKSTTIKMILGLMFPTAGKIAVYGRPPSDVAVKARIGFLPEESYLYPFLDARETLDFYGRLFHQPRAERMKRIDALLDMVGLSSVAYRRVGEYSKGMQRRIGLAQALINDPDLLILDEPTSGLDPIGTNQFKERLTTLAARGKTIILSSHLLADVEDICDRVCILYGGKVRAMGGIDDLLARDTLTQITTDSLDPALVEKVRHLLASAGKSLVEVTTPRDKLEALFLRIVKEAQEQRLVTGGAMAGGQVAEFLRPHEAQGQEVIAELVASSKHPAESDPGEQAGAARKAQPAAQKAKPAEPAVEVLTDLISPAARPQPPASPLPPAGGKTTPAAASRGDRSVIDELLGGKSDKNQ